MELQYLKQAYDDIGNIIEYISQDSLMIATKFITKILNYINYLTIFPEMGVLIIPNYNVRKLIYYNYIILYQIDYANSRIYILTVFNSKKDINLILKHIQKFLP